MFGTIDRWASWTVALASASGWHLRRRRRIAWERASWYDCEPAAVLCTRRKIEIDPDTPGDTLSSVRGEIVLRNVAFHYPARPDVTVFRSLSLRAEPGKTLALVGGSGSGKSTVVALVMRWYDVLDGGVYLDGVDIRNLQLRWLRSQASRRSGGWGVAVLGWVASGTVLCCARHVQHWVWRKRDRRRPPSPCADGSGGAGAGAFRDHHPREHHVWPGGRVAAAGGGGS